MAEMDGMDMMDSAIERLRNEGVRNEGGRTT